MMKRFLLCVMTMLCAVTGAWATDGNGTFYGSSTWAISGSTLTINVANRNDLGQWYNSNTKPSDLTGITKVVITGTIYSKTADNSENGYGSDGAAIGGIFKNYLVDLSGANMPTVTIYNVTSIVVGQDSDFPKNIIVPSAYTSDPSSFPACQAYGAISGGINLYGISGTTLNASLGDLTNANISAVKGSCTTLKAFDFSSGDLSSTGFSTYDFSNTTLTGTTTVPSGTTVYVNSTVEKAYVTGTDQANVVVRFNGNMTAAAGGSLGTNITNALANYSTNNSVSNIETLNITGTMTTDDVSWLNSNKNNLGGLTTVNLTGLSGFGAGVSKSTIEAALPNGVTVNWSPLFYSTADGVTTITVLTPGGATSEALTAAGVPASINDGTMKIVGEVTAADITNINAHVNNGWATHRVDLSEATLSSGQTMPRLSGSPQCLNTYYLILPVGSSTPTDEQIAYTNDNAYNTTNGIYNGYDDLKYIIIPAETEGGHAKIFVNNPKNNGMASAIDPYDIAVINANNPSVIDVYNMDNAFDASTFSTLQSSINTTWSSKTVVYHRSTLPYATNECNVTINMDEANGQTFAQILSVAHTAVTTAGQSGICTLKVTGPLTAADITALNTVMGSGNSLATITGLDLGEATGMTQEQVNALAIPTTLAKLTIPANRIVTGNLKTAAAACTNLMYVYSPTSNNQTKAEQFVADYVWMNNAGGLAAAVTNEAKLKTAVYVKVESDVANSVALNGTDCDLTNKGISDSNDGNHGWQYIDLSGTLLTAQDALDFKAPHYLGFRIILPNNVVTNEHMAMFASNSNIGAIAAVYTYNTATNTLKIMECVDASYDPAALADPRIMKSGTTEVKVVSGYYNGNTYAQFGTNLLAALNNMGKSTFSVTKDNVTINYDNTVGLGVKTISIETTSAAPNELTFDNPTITTLNIKGLVQKDADLKFGQCSSLTTLDLSSSTLKSVSNKTTVTVNNTPTTYTCTTLSSIDLSASAIGTTTDLAGATSLATFTTTDETIFNGAVDLTSSHLASFTSSARFGGDIKLNASANLASVDLSGATFNSTTSVIHVDSAVKENNDMIDGLKKTDGVKVPSSFEGAVATRVHPYNAFYVTVASSVAPACTFTSSDMAFHDREAASDGDHYRYWYKGSSNANAFVTIGISEGRRIADVIDGNSSLSIVAEPTIQSVQHDKIKVVGPLTDADIAALKRLNCTALDLSEATSGVVGSTIGELLKTSFSNTSVLGVHENVRFIALPDTCTRDYLLNENALKGLKNSVYSVIAINNTSEGKDLTSYSFKSGSLQPAVVIFESAEAISWTKIKSTDDVQNKYASTVSTFKKLKISGLINAYDLCKANQELDAEGHLKWAQDVDETTDKQTREFNGGHKVYGPFSSCFLLTEIDLRDAYFEEKPGNAQGISEEYKRYYVEDMTLSALDVISTATYKVVIPQNKKVHEIPADFMNCATYIRAICIPSNIQAIRTRAFWTIDYVWTTPDAFATSSTTNDPEGINTRLDNGAALTIDKGANYIKTSALRFNSEKHKYEENPDFLDSYYTADYSGVNGGGSYTFGSTLKLIETGAFANTQPNVKDVYVLNINAPECHVDAFNTMMYTGNGGYLPQGVDDKIITRSNYFNSRWITMLHYPRQTTDPQIQRYTDPTRSYSIATGLRDGKGAPLYFPNQSEFIRAYQQGTYGYTWNAWGPTRLWGSVNNGTLTNTTSGWTAANQAIANELYVNYKDTLDTKIRNGVVLTSMEAAHKYYTFYDVTLGNTTAPEDIVPYYQVNWTNGAYTTEDQGNLYPKAETADEDHSGETTKKDYRGWHQFVLNSYAANTVLDEEPYRSYIADNEWWTICSPFDITRAEAIQLFGTEDNPPQLPYVSRLMYVIRESDKDKIYLNFSDNLMEKKEGRATSTCTVTVDEGTGDVTVTNASQHGTLNENGVVTIGDSTPGDDDVVISAGVPYLIKPNLTVPLGGGNFNRLFQVYTDADYEKLSADQKASTSPKAIKNTVLYLKIKDSQEMSGERQITLVESGCYSVPAFTTDATENVEMDGNSKKSYPIGDYSYFKSKDYKYTFVGSFYNSYMPQYSYFLGWNPTANKAQFFYYDGNVDMSTMRWANETGIICPTAEGFDGFKVSPRSGIEPAQWKLFAGENDKKVTKLKDDSFGNAVGGSARDYIMIFNAPAVDNEESTDIGNISTDDGCDVSGIVALDGRKMNGLNGLRKGVYIKNGKKIVVK